MSAHTPGEWTIKKGETSLRVIGADGYAVAAVRAKYWPDPAHRTIQRANACLIAAAPDLLEAGRALVTSACAAVDVHELAEAVAQMRIAIAKAEGRKP